MTYLDLLILCEEYVESLDISMDDIVGMKIVNSLTQFPSKDPYFFLAEKLFFFSAHLDKLSLIKK